MTKLYIVLFLLFSCLIQAQNKYKTYFKLSEQDKNLGYIFKVTANDNNGKELTPIITTNNGYDLIYFECENINNNIIYKTEVIQGANDFNTFIKRFTLDINHQKTNGQPLNQFFEIQGDNVKKISGSIFLSGITLECIDLEDIDTEKEVN